MTPFLFVVPSEMPPRTSWRNVVLRDGAHLAAWSHASIRRIEWRDFDDARAEVVDRPVRVLVRRATAAGLTSWAEVEAFHARDCPVWLEPASGHDEELLQAAAARQIPVLFSDERADLLASARVLDILDFYLFTKSLSAPIEPFHSLLLSALRRSGRTLLNVWFGNPLAHFYVHESGAVSLCRSWSERADKVYGQADQEPGDWQASRAYREMERLVASPSGPCESCPVRHLCGGALLLVRPGAECDYWREALERVRIVAARFQRSSQRGR